MIVSGQTRCFGFGRTEYGRTYVLGEEIVTQKYGTVRFIKSTAKGFNFLVLSTSKVLLNKAMYVRKYAHKEIPNGITKVHVFVPEWATRIGL